MRFSIPSGKPGQVFRLVCHSGPLDNSHEGKARMPRLSRCSLLSRLAALCALA